MDNTTTVGFATTPGDGRLVGVSSWRTHDINAKRTAKNQTVCQNDKYRFTPRTPFTFYLSTTGCTSGPVSRILSPGKSRGGSHLSRAPVARRLKQPTRRSMDTGRIQRGSRLAGTALLSCLALLPMGVAWPLRSPGTPVGSYPTFSPSPGCARQSVSVALSASHPAWVLPSIAPYGVQTFLGLHRIRRRPRLPGPLAHDNHLNT